MNIYTAEQIRAWDAYTIKNEPVTPVDLMERAAGKCVRWLLARPFHNGPFKIFCGKGNNGGDGLAIARMLVSQGIDAVIYILEFGRQGTEDFQINLQRLHKLPVDIHYIQSTDHFPVLQSGDVVIDALFGSGLNKPLQSLGAALVQHLNKSKNLIISIDVPSGLFMDQSSKGNVVVNATFTLTFQTYKMALLMAENASNTGEVHVLDIGLHPKFLREQPSPRELLDKELVKNIFRPRQRFAHKGVYGHALIIAGGYGKTGAAVLAVKACLRSGAGLTTAYLPRCGYAIMQTSAPEAMTITDENEDFINGMPQELERFTSIGIGPGIGTDEATRKAVADLVAAFRKPIVADADALNCLALQKEALARLPPYSILTPHPKEFERLFGTAANDFERIAIAQQKAKELKVIIVLKGHHTAIALPGGALFFNNTGNAGMAKGGSGDVLTGIITALLAQGYVPEVAAILGVYLHGLAGDLAAEAVSQEYMTATDIITFLSQAFLRVNKWHLTG